MAERIEGLRFVGPKLDDVMILSQFEDDIRALCEACGVSFLDVQSIEFRQDLDALNGQPGYAPTDLVFSIVALDETGAERFTCGAVPHNSRTCRCDLVVETVVHPVPFEVWPSWWIPYTGLFIDQAVVGAVDGTS